MLDCMVSFGLISVRHSYDEHMRLWCNNQRVRTIFVDLSTIMPVTWKDSFAWPLIGHESAGEFGSWHVNGQWTQRLKGVKREGRDLRQRQHPEEAYIQHVCQCGIHLLFWSVVLDGGECCMSLMTSWSVFVRVADCAGNGLYVSIQSMGGVSLNWHPQSINPSP